MSLINERKLFKNLADKMRMFTETRVDNTILDPVQTSPAASFGIAVQKGLIPGFSSQNIFGNNPQVDFRETADVWQGEGIYNFATVAAQAAVFSTDPDDTALGVGAQSILIVGINDQREFDTEIVPLNGTTPVFTTKLFFRVNSARVFETGVTNNNEGDISISIGADVVGFIETGRRKTFQYVLSTPKDVIAYIRDIDGSVKPSIGAFGEKSGVFVVEKKGFDEQFFEPIATINLNSRGSSYAPKGLPFPVVVDPEQDIRLTFTADTNDCDITAESLVVIEDTTISGGPL